MCVNLFSKVTVQAVTESDNKAAYCHTPVLQRHRPFRGRCLYCQTHHFFHRLVCRKHLRFLIAWRITLFSDPMAFVSDSDNSYRWNEVDKRFSVDDTPNRPPARRMCFRRLRNLSLSRGELRNHSKAWINSAMTINCINLQSFRARS